jgi:hypothetical protein
MATGEGEASGKEGHSMWDCLWSIHCVHIMLEGRGGEEGEGERENVIIVVVVVILADLKRNSTANINSASSTNSYIRKEIA